MNGYNNLKFSEDWTEYEKCKFECIKTMIAAREKFIEQSLKNINDFFKENITKDNILEYYDKYKYDKDFYYIFCEIINKDLDDDYSMYKTSYEISQLCLNEIKKTN